MRKPEPRDVLIGLIDPPANPARMSMNEEKLDELCSSIRKIGIIQRLNLARTGDRYEVIAGHRRYMAAMRVGLASVPADVYPTRDDALEAIKHAENRFREDMSSAEEAVYFDELLNGPGAGDVDRVCEIVGERRAYVEDRLLLLQGSREVFDALAAKKIKFGVAQEINKVTDERVRRAILYDAIQNGATVAVVRGMVTEWQRGADLGSAPLPPLESSSAPSAVPLMNYFTCLVCGKTDNVQAMQPHNVHNHCKLAILDPMLDAYHGRG
jgi:ParB family chromosome partitioning protein